MATRRPIDLDALIADATNEVELLEHARQVVYGTQDLRKIRAVEEAHRLAVTNLTKLIKKRGIQS